MAIKYLLFAGHDYYPSGGALDFRGSFDTVDEAKAAVAADTMIEWAHVCIATDDGELEFVQSYTWRALLGEKEVTRSDGAICTIHEWGAKWSEGRGEDA